MPGRTKHLQLDPNRCGESGTAKEISCIPFAQTYAAAMARESRKASPSPIDQ